jgi:hypothetical protein
VSIQFRTGLDEAKQIKVQGNPFQAFDLNERKDIVMRALDRLNAQNINERQGHELFHSCILPFGNHPNGDRDPSCSINYDMMAANCWVCGGGHFLWWVAMVNGFETSSQALTWLVDELDVALDRPMALHEIMSFLESLTTQDLETRQPPPEYDMGILDQWKFIHPYLTEWRGIPEKNIVDLTVGWDQQTNRITIPHIFRGKLLGWQSRRLADDGTPKYKSTPDMPKDTTLYNFSEGPEAAVIVESPMTVIRHNHVARLMATFGASVTKNQMDLIVKSRTEKMILWFDNDEAGWNATDTVAEYLMHRGTVYAVQNPYAGDPGDLPSEVFENTLSECVVPYALWTRPRGDELVVFEGDEQA